MDWEKPKNPAAAPVGGTGGAVPVRNAKGENQLNNLTFK
jgi:hypothetical protein